MPKLIKYYQKRGYEIIEYCFHEGYIRANICKMIKKYKNTKSAQPAVGTDLAFA